jgi:hypothetical protein
VFIVSRILLLRLNAFGAVARPDQSRELSIHRATADLRLLLRGTSLLPQIRRLVQTTIPREILPTESLVRVERRLLDEDALVLVLQRQLLRQQPSQNNHSVHQMSHQFFNHLL